MLVGLFVGTVVGIGIGAALLGCTSWGRKLLARKPPVQKNIADRLVELSEVTGGLAHEIRNPLSTVKMNLGLLLEDWRDARGDDTDLRRRSLTRLEGVWGEAERLERILDDFLRYAGKHELALRRVDLNELVDKVLEFTSLQAARGSITVRVSRSSEPAWCDLDVHLFEQALLNIVLNTHQALADTGGEMLVTIGKENGYARLDLADTGPGMTPKVQSKVFQAYYSTRSGGTGLGLSITRRIVTEHNGTIEVFSKPGQGTRFTIRIPLATS